MKGSRSGREATAGLSIKKSSLVSGWWNITIRFNSPIDNASVATLPLGTRGNLTTEAACRRFGSLTGFDDWKRSLLVPAQLVARMAL